MRPVSARFLETIRGSHSEVSRATVCSAGQSGTSPVGTRIPIVSGEINYDATANVRARLDMTTRWEWPEDQNGLLTPYGNEIYVERGMSYGDGTTEWVGQGYYRIVTPEQEQAPDGPIDITAQDRMSGIVEARPLAPKQYPTGTSVEDVFDDLVLEVYPGAVIEFDFDAANTLFTASHSLEDDRYGFLDDIVTSLAKVWYWDYRGHLLIRDAPSIVEPVWDITHGRKGVVVKVSRSLSRENAHNAVVASGEQAGEDPPVRAVALDLNPGSPTYWYGPFGKVPLFYTSSFLKTTDQCQAAADAKLAREVGVPYSINFASLTNSALEVLDPVRISWTDKRAPELHVIDKLTMPLKVTEAMTGTTKQQLIGGVGA